jgi:hypothetical protein
LLECREYFLSQRLPVTFVPPQIHRTNPAERAVRTGKTHLISILSFTHPDFPDDLWDHLLPYAEITLNIMRPWRPDPSLSAWSGLHRLPYDFSAHPIHPPGQLCIAFSGPEHRAFILGLALTQSLPLPMGLCCCRPDLSASPSPSLTSPYPYFTSPHPTFPTPYPRPIFHPSFPHS